MHSTSEHLNIFEPMLTDLKGEIDSKTIIAEDFNTLLLAMVRLSREKISLKKNWT